MRRPCWRSAATGLIGGLAADKGPAISAFEHALDQSPQAADSPGPARHRLRPDLRRCARNFLGVAAKVARANHGRDNDVIARLAQRHGRLVDLHAHFLSGDPSWFAQTSRA